MSKPTAQQIIEEHSTIIVTALEDYREWWSNNDDAEVVAEIDSAIDAINGFSAEDSALVATPPFYTHPDSNAFISWD
jgi:hypothetical protein